MDLPVGAYDIIIVGGGPAGLTAGIYASRARLNALLLESFSVMGQVTMTEAVENYPGIEKVSGFDFISTLKKQATSFGLKSQEGTVKSIKKVEEAGTSLWQVEDGKGAHKALSVIIASGASPKRLGVPGEKEFLGRGISYCATCDGAFFRDKDIVVVGGGDTAVEEALFLTRFGSKVTLIHRRDRLRATKILEERAKANKKMEFVLESVLEEISGTETVEKVKVKNINTGKHAEIPCKGVFLFVGWQPNTDFVKGLVKLDEKGNILVDKDMKTSQEGIFAGGDCCTKKLHQIVTASGDGAVAAYSAQHYVEILKGTAYD